MAAAGVAMNEDAAMAISMVFTCVAALADAVSSLPLRSFIETDKVQKEIKPQPDLISDPWPEGTQQDFYTQVMTSLALRGNFYGKITVRDRLGYASVIMPLHPDQVLARRVNGKREYRVNGHVEDTNDIVHIPALLMSGSFIGMNPVEYMRRSWGVLAAAEQYGAGFFRNSANPSGVISVDEDLEEDQVREMARQWQAAHGGVQNSNLPAILTGGAKWQQVSINPEDAQFIATRQLGRDDVRSFFRLPPHFVGDSSKETAFGNGIEQNELHVVTNVLRPWTNRISGYLDRLRPPNEHVQFDFSDRLRGDTLQRYQAYTLARNGGWMSANDILAREKQPGIGDIGDVYLAPLNFAPIERIMDGSANAGGNGGPGGGIANDPNAPAKGDDTDALKP